MKDRLFQLLGIEPEEWSLVSMLLMQSIFLGIFYGAFDISAHSLFLSIFDEKMMARAYVISGLAGIIMTSLYTWFQARITFRHFATSNLVVLSIITLVLWLALLFNPSNTVVFTVFVMLGPINILAMLGFWGTTGRLFTLRQGKRLFGLIDAGLIIGVIVSCYAIPVLLTLNFQSHNILLISTLSIFFAAIVQLVIGRRFTFITSGTAEKSEKDKGLAIFRKDRYVRIMAIFITLSVMTAFFVQYSFMAVTREQYPLEEDMARFLGLFTGSMMIFTLLLKVLVFSYMIRNYGLKTCLAISPVLVAGFTALAIIIGMTMGYSQATSGFVIFFLLLALSRLFSKSLKDAIESPSFKVIYQTVEEKNRFRVQSGIDGTINEISALSSGLLLAGLGALSFVTLIHFSWVLFAIIAAWILVAFRLYIEYRKSIRNSLETTTGYDSEQLTIHDWGNLGNKAAGILLFKTEYFRLACGKLDSIEKTGNRWFFQNMLDYSESTLDPSLLPALQKIASSGSIEEGLRQRSAGIIDQIEESGGNPGLLSGKTRAIRLSEKIINARKNLADSRMPQTTEILRLLRDNNIDSKRYALFMIGKFRMTDMLSEVSNCLSMSGLENDAFNVMESFGADAHEELLRLFMSSSGNNELSRAVIRLMAGSSSEETSEFLYSRLWSNARPLRELAAIKLVECGFRPNPEEKDKLNQMISDTIGIIIWNISARLCIVRQDEPVMLNSIEKEIQSWDTFLFNILSIAYDQASIEKIRLNLESGTVGSVNYALEMVDIVIDDSIKPKLVAYIDSVPDEEKTRNLHQFYPGEITEFEFLLEDIINRDYNLIGIWARACALRTSAGLFRNSFAESVIALLFSPEKILQEEAARLISRSKPELFGEIKGRISIKNRDELSLIISGEKSSQDLLFEKVSFLSQLFPEIPEDTLIILAGSVKFSPDPLKVKLEPANDHIVWNIKEGQAEKMSYVTQDDTAGDKSFMQGGPDNPYLYVLRLGDLEEFYRSYPEYSYEIYRYLDNYHLKPSDQDEIR